jgi:hypothetical protein
LRWIFLWALLLRFFFAFVFTHMYKPKNHHHKPLDCGPRHLPKSFMFPSLMWKVLSSFFPFCHLDFSKPIPILFRSTSMVALANARASCLIGQGYFTFHYILYILFLSIYLIHCENIYFVYFTFIHSQICNTPISFLTVTHIYH